MLRTQEGSDSDTESASSNRSGKTLPSPCAVEAPDGPGEAQPAPSTPSYRLVEAADPPANTIPGPPSGTLASAIAQAVSQPTTAEAAYPADHKREQTQNANVGAHTEGTLHINAKATPITESHAGITNPLAKPTLLYYDSESTYG